MALCPQCGGRGKFYFGDAAQPTCPRCAGTGEVFEPTPVPPLPPVRGESRTGEFLLALVGLACFIGAYLAFAFSSDVVLSYFEIVYVREDNFGHSVLYATATFLVVAIVSRYWGPAPGLAIGLIPLLPVVRALFADDLGGFSQVVSVDAGSSLVVFATGSALFLNLAAAMLGHDRAKKKSGVSGVRSIARLNGGVVGTGALAIFALAVLAAVQVAWAGFVAANAYP